jgi:hypothetical protein
MWFLVLCILHDDNIYSVFVAMWFLFVCSIAIMLSFTCVSLIHFAGYFSPT